MPTGKKRETIRKFGKSLKGALSRRKSKGTNPGANPAPSQPASSLVQPCTTTPSNVTSGSVAAGSSATGSQSTLPGAQSLNPPLPVALAPAKNEAFEKALKSYINELTEADKKAFLTASASDIMDRLKEMQNDKSGSSGKSRLSSQFTSRLQKVLQCVKQFMGSIVIAIGHHPEISALVVGGFNCILMVLPNICLTLALHQNLALIIFLLYSLPWGTWSSLKASQT